MAIDQEALDKGTFNIFYHDKRPNGQEGFQPWVSGQTFEGLYAALGRLDHLAEERGCDLEKHKRLTEFMNGKFRQWTVLPESSFTFLRIIRVKP